MSAAIDRAALARVRQRELRRFAERTPKSAQWRARAREHMPNGVPMSWMSGLYRFDPIVAKSGAGARFEDIDGNVYLDFNVCDLSMSLGFAPPAIVAAIHASASTGVHFLLPTEDACIVAEELAASVGLPYWQFTVSASTANTEVLRIARHRTGRSKVLLFEGHYHGHIDETLVASEAGRAQPSLYGLLPEVPAQTVIVPFNEIDAAEAALSREDIALVLTEPALTNCNIVLPDENFLTQLSHAARTHGTLLCLDEAHTFQFAYGGLTGAGRLAPDFVVLGKGLGTGVSFGLYGMSAAVGEFFARNSDTDIGPKGIATGGTTFASALAVTCARVALQEGWTSDTYRRLDRLGTQLANGLEDLFAQRRLPWRAFRLGARSGFCLNARLPRNGEEAARSLDYEFIDTRRIFMANRGIWDAVATAGPQASCAHGAQDIEQYLRVAAQFLDSVTVPC